MILTDLLSEYKYVCDALFNCNTYFSICNELINDFFTKTSNAISAHCKIEYPAESHYKTLVTQLKDIFNTSYDFITKMNTFSAPLHVAMAKLKEHSFQIDALGIHVEAFLEEGGKVIAATNSIISAQSYGMRADTLLPNLISPLLELTQNYTALIQYYHQFSCLDEMLFENIPESISQSPKYNHIELHSLKSSLNMDSFIDDLKNLSNFICQFELIMSPENSSCKVYTQRIESGSLRIVWGSNTIELSGISDIIKAISNGIRAFRLTAPEKQLKDEKARAIKLQNDEKELAIINSQIASIAKLTGLSPDNPADVEKLQKLCLPLIRYLYSNPIGSIGDFEYNLNDESKLIEIVYNQIESHEN